MTVPSERSFSIIQARNFLVSLCDPKKTPKVPKYIRKEAAKRLRHYPGNFYLNESAKALPKIWGEVPVITPQGVCDG